MLEEKCLFEKAKHCIVPNSAAVDIIMICHCCAKTRHYNLEGFGNDPLVKIGSEGPDFFSITQAAFKRFDSFIAQSYLMAVYGGDSGCLYGHYG